MAADHDAPDGGAPQDRQAEREAKLAQALRANLRRRKAEGRRDGAAVVAKPDRGESA